VAFWLEWKDSGNPCTDEAINIFYAVTNITHGNGRKTSFGMLLGWREKT
jgi:hypothetical protein